MTSKRNAAMKTTLIRSFILALSAVVLTPCALPFILKANSRTQSQNISMPSALTATAAQSQSASGATASRLPAGATRLRGALGFRSIEMELRRAGERVAGSYAYDGNAQSLTLAGRIDGQGNITLTETDPRGRRTGSLALKLQTEDEGNVRLSGEWTRPGGNLTLPVSLSEQRVELANGVRLVTRTVSPRRNHHAVFPQLTGGGATLARGVAEFNRRVNNLLRESWQMFDEEQIVRTNYEVLLANDNLISLWLTNEYSGGTYSDWRSYGLTYDLRAAREVSLEELFRRDAPYAEAIRVATAAITNRMARELEAEQRREGSQSEPYSISPEGVNLESPPVWAMTPRGVVLYFDLPHVAGYFRRIFIPYAALREVLKPDSPATRFVR